MQFLSAIDLAKNEIQNARAQNLASAPSSPVTGQFYYDTGTNTLMWWNGSAWKSATGDTINYSASASTLVTGGLSAPGSAASVSRGDHVHSLPAVGGAPAALTVGGIAAAGTVNGTAASYDHAHAMPGFGASTATTTAGASKSDGVATTIARSDHTHGTPTHVGTDHAAIKLSDLAGVNAGNINLNGYRLTSVSDPSASTDAANKFYVDSVASGLDPKGSVRAATTAAGTLASSFANGSVIDGVTLATGNRILIKDQAAGAENGIYTVNASGAPTRATDADTSAKVTPGMFTFVEEGTTNADSGWVLTNNGTITLGTTALTFAQFSGAGQITAGAGLTKTGNTIDAVGTANRITVNADNIDIASNYAGQNTITTLGTITTGVWNGTDVAVADGGTGASTAAAARTNLGATGKYAVTFGGATSQAITHSLNTTDVQVEVFVVATGATVSCDVTRTDANTVTLGFASAPAASSLRCVVVG